MYHKTGHDSCTSAVVKSTLFVCTEISSQLFYSLSIILIFQDFLNKASRLLFIYVRKGSGNTPGFHLGGKGGQRFYKLDRNGCMKIVHLKCIQIIWMGVWEKGGLPPEFCNLDSLTWPLELFHIKMLKIHTLHLFLLLFTLLSKNQRRAVVYWGGETLLPPY